MIASLYDMVFGCQHGRLSFPLTLRGKHRKPSAALVTGTYVVCLDCGREFPYDWDEMKVVSAPHPRQRQESEAVA